MEERDGIYESVQMFNIKIEDFQPESGELSTSYDSNEHFQEYVCTYSDELEG